MLSFSDLIQQGSAHAWLFIPSAILLGALHGLEPGHSKTMMAAFIVAVRGTVGQAVLLGLAATASHTLVVWAIGLGGMYLWQGIDAETFEPYFQLASAALIIVIALWMLWRTWQDEQRAMHGDSAHHHDHDHDHDHSHHHAHEHHAQVRRIEDHGRADHGSHARVHDHGDSHAETCDAAVSNLDSPARAVGLDLTVDGYQDAHERAHADDIQRRFANRKVTTWQIVVFGLTGGLIPCPAAITVLLLCLQLKEFTVGFALVLCFSIGLAITLVTVGAVAALSVKHVSKRWSWFSTFARRAPYVSSLLIIAVGVYVGVNGWIGLSK